MDLRELYQDVILDHGRHPRNHHALAAPSHMARGHNPLCGDRVTIFLRLDGARIAEASFEGRGCAISTASASLMTELVIGKMVAEANALFRIFRAQATEVDAPSVPVHLIEDAERLAPLTGVKAYPARQMRDARLARLGNGGEGRRRRCRRQDGVRR